MYAVIKTGGKQYRVEPGDVLVVEKLAHDEIGGEVAFDQVLMLNDGGETVVGAPLIEGAVVRATFIETRKGEKIKVFKKIRRQGYRRTKGHRQHESVLRVIGLEGGGKSASWGGEVDLTPRSVLVARARGLAPMIDSPAVQARSRPALGTADEAPLPETMPAGLGAGSTVGGFVEQPISETPATGAQSVVDEQAAAEVGSQAGEEVAPKTARARKAKADLEANAPPVVDPQAAANPENDGRA